MGLLTQDFNKAAEPLAALQARARHAGEWDWDLFPFAAENIPVLDLDSWGGAWCLDNNCYNFAVDRRDNMYRQPGDFFLDAQFSSVREHYRRGWGELSSTADLDHYTQVIVSMAERDGLVPLPDFESREGGFPVALFFRHQHAMWEMYSNDYHWFALRRTEGGDLIWAHKMGRTSPMDCDPVNDLTRVFDVARRKGYDYFYGFFEVRPDRLGRAASSVMAP